MPEPFEIGAWGDVFSWPLVGLHAILTPDGKVLTFGTDINGVQSGLHYYDVWDPVTNTHTTLEHVTHTDIFCSVALIVPETGEILISGGDARPLGAVNAGIPDVNVYDFEHTSLESSPTGPMAYARWYPTMLTLATGQLVILGGRDGANDYNGFIEVYTPNMGWRTLTGAYLPEFDVISNYPRSWVASDGKIVTFSADAGFATVYAIDPTGRGSVDAIGQLPFQAAWWQPAVMFDQDRVLVIGNDGSAWIMDISGGTVVFERTADIGVDRKWSNMLVLPDGRVLLTGGSSVDNQLVDVNNTAALWDPDTGLWTMGDEAAVPRLYHSTLLLLPDGTVLSQGGGAPGPLTNLNGEIFTPDYLFDETGGAAVRPVITAAPQELAAGATFTLTVDDAQPIETLALLAFDSATHSLNMAARRLELPFTIQPDGSLLVTLPDNVNVLTPGYWMLFAINDQGTPSIASTIPIDVEPAYYLPERLPLDLGVELQSNATAAYDGFDDSYLLTPNAALKKGSVMSEQRIDLSQAFDLTFEINLGGIDAGADGMAFVLHNDAAGAAAIGYEGGALGALGITNGLGIEFDIYQNAVTATELANDHTNFFDTDVLTGDPAVSAVTDLGNIEDGAWHSVRVSWDGTALTYWFDGTQIATLNQDISATYLGGSQFAYFGFTGGTGGATTEQIVRILELHATLEDGAVVAADRAALPQAPEFVVNGDAAHESIANDYVLTPDAAFKKGSVMTEERIDLRQAFDLTFEINLGANDAAADGMAFVLHNDAAGAAAIGYEGGALGALGIANGLGIEFDIYQGLASATELANDHTNFFDTDVLTGDPSVSAATDLGNIEDGAWHTVRVSWDGTALTYWFDGTLITTLNQDISATYLGGSQFAYLGFTAGTGGATTEQMVRLIAFDATAEDGTLLHMIGPNTAPISQDDSYTVDANGVLTVSVANGVIANDTDPDGDALSICEDSHILAHEELLAPAHGTLTMNDDGSFTYVPDAGFVGLDYFLYCVEDAFVCVDGVVTITVTAGGNQAPVIAGGDTVAVSVAENTTAVATVVATDANAGDTLTYSIAGGADAASFTIDSVTGALAFVTAPDFETPSDAGADNTYEVIVRVADGNGGIDTQTITVSVQNVAGGTITGTSSANTLAGTGEEDTLNGLGGADTLQGLAGNDLLNGGSGNDLLDGGAGNDIMTGGTGNDAYVVAATGDIVVELAGEGTDTIRTVLGSYSLAGAANVENLTFLGTGDFAGTGSSLVNVITGSAGNDTLDGGTGADRLVGLGGNDTYLVDVTGDVVVEASNGGVDTVLATSQSYTLSSNVENLTFSGTGGFVGTGNGLANIIAGGVGIDTLSGGGGNDLLIGGAEGDLLNGGGGNDTLDGGTGGDAMAGGSGNDIYLVDSALDAVVESAGAGSDTVRTTLASYTLGDNVELLNFVGVGDFTGIGNALANSITGGGGNDTLSGGGGNDRLQGGAGNDSLTGGAGSDTLVFRPGFGNDTILSFGDVSGNNDIIEFSTDVFATFAAVQAAMAQVGADVVITADATNQIILKNVALSGLDAGDFRFVA